jgi:hypothetical protein
MIIDKGGQPDLYCYLLRLGLIEHGAFFGQLRADLTPADLEDARALVGVHEANCSGRARRRAALRAEYEQIVSRRLLSDFETELRERISSAWLHHRRHHGAGRHISRCRRCGPAGRCAQVWQTCQNLKWIGWW